MILHDRVLIDPNDFGNIHMIASDDREVFQSWLDSNYPNHVMHRETKFQWFYDRERWVFYVKVAEGEDHAFEAAVKALA